MEWADSGNRAGNLVYSAVSPAISRYFRQLHDIHGLSAALSRCTFEGVPNKGPAGCGRAFPEPKRLGC